MELEREEDFIWKCLDDYGRFYQKRFARVDPAIGLDFFYTEIYHWDASPTKCCYEMFDNIIRPGDIVVDLGANIGFFTRKAAKTAGKVIAVEASPEHFSCLVENTHDMKNVEYANSIAIGEVAQAEHRHMNTVYSKRCAKSTITLAQIMERFELDRIDFLKVDIEGAEYEMLLNTPKEVLDKIDRISIEMHGDFFPDEPGKDDNFFLPNKIRNSWTWFFNNGNSSETFFYFKNL